MAIEFKHRGRVWRTDTVEEAVKLRARLEVDDQLAFELGQDLPYDLDNAVVKWTHDTITDLLRGAGPLQRRFLKVLAEEGEITSDKLLKELSLDSEVSLAGVLSGLSKQLKKLGFKTWELYTVKVRWSGKSKTRSFSLVKEFELVAAELGWPDKWD